MSESEDIDELVSNESSSKIVPPYSKESLFLHYHYGVKDR